MCGIAGVFSEFPVEAGILSDMTRRVAHRGPDGEGYWLLHERGGRGRFFEASEMTAGPAPVLAGFGHRRLAILDLSDAGKQPMCDPDGRVWLVYNGEVFNFVELRRELAARGHTFRGTSDTEVVLAAYLEWGTGCFARFNGMWALAVADTRSGTLLLSRDRLGIKPLYYATVADVILFASEIKQILATPWVEPRADMDTLVEYIDSGYQLPGTTFFQGIQEVLPGTTMTFPLHGGKTPRTESYWEPELHPGGIPRSAEAVERVREIFRDSVSIRLRSDVPVGVCLSGGLDSSSIFAQMHALSGGNSPFAAFTAVYGDRRYDEDEFARIMLRRTGSAGCFVYPTPTGFLESLDAFTYHHEEPAGSMSVYAAWCVMNAAASEGVKVLLNGQGGDELFSGYWHAYYIYLAKTFRKAPLEALREVAGAMLPSGNPELLRCIPAHLRQYLSRRKRLNRRVLRQRWADYGRTTRRNWAEEALDVTESEFRLRELRSIHLPRLLKWEDRNSMAFGIEGRYPFLDYRLIETVLSIPVEFNFRHGWNKYVLRLAFADLLPAEICWRKTKVGFETPQSEWMRTTLRQTLLAWSRNPSTVTCEIVDPAAFQALAGIVLESKGQHRMDERHHLFMRLYLLDSWVRTLGVRVPIPAESPDAETLRGARGGDGYDGKPGAAHGYERVRYRNGELLTVREEPVDYSARQTERGAVTKRKSLGIRVCVVTSEWPTAEYPFSGIFIRRHVEHLVQEGVEAEVFPFRGNKNVWQYFKAWVSLHVLLKKKSFDIVHAHFGQSALVVFPSSKPFVVTFRGSDLEGIIGKKGKPTAQGRLLQAVSKWAARRADMVILVSKSLRRHIDPSITPHILPSGVDADLFRPLERDACREEVGWEPSEFVVVFVGNPDDPNKRYRLAEEAVQIAAKKRPCRLELLWGIRCERLPVYLNAADLLVMTSAREGSPNVVKEAIACAVPVVSVPVGDVVERLAGVAGSVVCPDDRASSIAEGILAAREYLETHGRPALVPDAVVSERENARKLIEWYRMLLDNRRVNGDSGA